MRAKHDTEAARIVPPVVISSSSLARERTRSGPDLFSGFWNRANPYQLGMLLSSM